MTMSLVMLLTVMYLSYKQMNKLRMEHDDKLNTHKITDAIKANLGLILELQF